MSGLQPFDLRPYVDIIHRHRLSALCTLLLGLATTMSLLLLLPDIYRSTELLVVQMPEVSPSDLEQSPGYGSRETAQSDPVMEGLERLSQETYTDARLAELIRELRLYGQSPSSRSVGSAVANMRKHIELTVPERSFNYENIPRQRQERGANLLQVAYEYGDPKLTQRVVERLTDLLMASSLAERTRSAARGRQFLEQSVAQAEEKLIGKEKELSVMKKHFAGSLPEQLAENVSELSHAEEELQSVNEALVTQQMAAQSNSDSSPQAKLTALQLQLDALRGQYSDQYPDVVELQREIAETKRDVAAQTSANSNAERAQNAETYTARVSKLQEQAANLRGQIVLLRERVALTPAHQQQLASVTRDYDVLQAQYQHLRDRELEARLNEELVRKREGQRLQVLEPASLPGRPVAPNRMTIAELGALVSVGLAIGIPFALYFTDTSFKEPDELSELYGLPVAGVIPLLAGAAPGSARVLRRAIVLTCAGCFLIVGAVWSYARLH